MRKPFAIYHEHPDWFRPLFAELARREIPYVQLDPRAHVYDPSEKQSPYALVFNRMSPSAYLRGGVQGMFFTVAYMAHLERLGVPVVNGVNGFSIELSKARQLTLLESLGLGYPKARVINHASKAVDAADGLRFPVVVKANIGGSGAGIVKYLGRESLAESVAANQVDLGVDHTALVQEFVPARGGHITRVETLGGKFLYAIKVYTTGESFNLCPADICQRADGVELVRAACPIDAPKTGLKVEGYTPPPEVIAACEKIMQVAGIDVGGIEYMIDDRDGRIVYYDINALSNFVADAPNVVGFDPFARLVDYLVKRAG
ncbi:hypothetical protein R5W24_001534 [Gemmata sp. JC717]|uniref:ATP-grasp domain-containing protein n=1 Tax=Gemmata algarum TaxID=2975278 RepID=UPI0021BB039A|nr:hypothetical protein [Gemmata algarum]MDY3552452.1 hypothetical protein [Gemmata algarum]